MTEQTTRPPAAQQDDSTSVPIPPEVFLPTRYNWGPPDRANGLDWRVGGMPPARGPLGLKVRPGPEPKADTKQS